MAEEYDAIVIGAGHNGLTCACYLARAGLRVLVLEQYHLLGGMTISEEVTLPGFQSDVHAYGYQFANLSPVPVELDLARYGFRLIEPDPAYTHVFPDGSSVSVYRDLEKTVQSIAQYSTRDAETWRIMFGAYLVAKDQVIASLFSSPLSLSAQSALYEQIPGGMDLYRASLQTVRSWCNQWFEAEQTKVLFAAWALHAGVAPDDAGGGNLAWLFNMVIQDLGNNVVAGGMNHLSQALARYLEAHGGVVRTSTPVAKILVENGRAVGVRLANGDEIRAREVVASSVDPAHLVVQLLGAEQIGPELVSKIGQYEWGDSSFGLYIALDGPVTYQAGADAGRAGYVHPTPPSLDFLARIYQECRAGLIPAEPLFIIGNESVVDPSRAPAGKHLLKILVANVPYTIKGDATGILRGTTWDEVKDQYADYLIDQLTARYIPDLKSRVLKRTALSPVDLERGVTSSVRGTILHGAFLPYQIGAARPIPELGAYKTPLPNLYLCGAGSHPGPGVSMAPGHNAARLILAELPQAPVPEASALEAVPQYIT